MHTVTPGGKVTNRLSTTDELIDSLYEESKWQYAVAGEDDGEQWMFNPEPWDEELSECQKYITNNGGTLVRRSLGTWERA